MRVSIYKTVAIGNVAENKELGDNSILVTPTEIMSFHDGEIKSNPEEMPFTNKDSSGNVSSGAIILNVALRAKWLPSNTNRMTAPDVRRGMPVEILTSGDSGDYFWRPLGGYDYIMKRETIIFGISNTKDEADTTLRPDNMYWFEFSSHSKRIALSTSRSDGEPVKFEMYFDLKTGIFTLIDDVGNSVEIRSLDHFIEVINADKTRMTADKREMFIFAADKTTIQGSNSIFTLQKDLTTLETKYFKGYRNVKR